MFLALLHSLNLCDKQQVIDYKEKYETLLQELEDYKQQMKYTNVANISYNMQSQNITSSHDKNNKTQLHFLKTYNNNLEERIRVLNNEIINKERELQLKLEHQEKVIFLFFNHEFLINSIKFKIININSNIIFPVISRRACKIETFIITKR